MTRSAKPAECLATAFGVLMCCCGERVASAPGFETCADLPEEATSGIRPAAPGECEEIAVDLLRLVDETHGVPFDCVPADLVELSQATRRGVLLRREAAASFEPMAAAADDAGLRIEANDGFRSVQEQCAVFAKKAREGIAAPPGFSEHHLGLAVDIDDAPKRWLDDHAHEFGFVESYPAGAESCTGYPAEPWHWRYVGPAAAEIRRRGLIAHEYLSGRSCRGTPLEP
ncbi:MAG: M15 family metallopeptidase [Deltaproteobacteria bacterium]|nr:M15 family metallopeptidase [Deltaproteobacteria bacterium]